jgi:hypothetical protein
MTRNGHVCCRKSELRLVILWFGPSAAYHGYENRILWKPIIFYGRSVFVCRCFNIGSVLKC